MAGMPTYEYVCKACGHGFEIVRSIHDDALTECPDCGGELRKVFAPPAISFKGSGFYATDHRRKAKASSEHREGRTNGTKKKEEQKKEGQKKDGGPKDTAKGGKTGEGGSAP